MTDTRAESRQKVRAGVVVITKLARELRRGPAVEAALLGDGSPR